MINLPSYKINKAIHPGKTLKETLEFLSISQKSLSDKTGLTVKHISNIINEKASITPETALKFENILGVSAEFWNNLDRNYRLTLARIEHKKHILSEMKKVSEYKETYGELKNKGLIEDLVFIQKNKERITENLLKYFKIFSFNSPLGIEKAAFRRYNASVNDKTIAAVIRAGELKAEKVETKSFNEEKLKKSLASIKLLSKKKYQEYMPEIEKILAETGIVLVAIPGFKKTAIQGISKWLSDDKAMIILKTDGQDKKTSQFEDLLFFNLFHEIGHILLHSKKKTFFDLEDKMDSKEEKEADKFATKTLMPDFDIKELSKYKGREGINAKKAIFGLSEKYNISKSIIAGQLSYHFKDMQKNIYQILNEHRDKVNYSNYLD